MISRLYRQLRSAAIRSPQELRRHTVAVTTFSVALAFACDVCNQMIFFVSWPVTLRSWALTIGIAVAVALPIARAIGKTNLALYRASRTDPLTGLLNRRALFEGTDDPDALIALMIADIDRFKAVNDTYGHLAGDAVLCTIAGLLQHELADLGRVGRLGGEEFALICDGLDKDVIVERLERLRATIARTPVVSDGVAMSVTISVGIAHRKPGQSFGQLYAEADRALYRAKAQGRNRVVVAEPAVPPFANGARPGEPPGYGKDVA